LIPSVRVFITAVSSGALSAGLSGAGSQCRKHPTPAVNPPACISSTRAKPAARHIAIRQETLGPNQLSSWLPSSSVS
jgi:hypothetical protein